MTETLLGLLLAGSLGVQKRVTKMAKSFNAQMADRFAKIRTDYATVNAFVHETAVLIAEHAEKTGDCSTAQPLVLAMPKSARREMLILWFKTFTPIVVKNDDGWTAKMHKKGDKLYVPFDIEAGRATSFTDLAAKHTEAKPMDYAGLVLAPARLAKQLEKRLEEGLIAGDEIETAKALISQLRGIRVVHVNAEAEVEEAPAEAPEAEVVVEDAALQAAQAAAA